MTKTAEVYVGIDPGWENLGFALSVKNKETGKLSKFLTLSESMTLKSILMSVFDSPSPT